MASREAQRGQGGLRELALTKELKANSSAHVYILKGILLKYS